MPIPDEHLSPINEPDIDGENENDVSATDLGEDAEITFDGAPVEGIDDDDLDVDDEEAVDELGTAGFGFGDPAD